jgi:hypothetical protein
VNGGGGGISVAGATKGYFAADRSDASTSHPFWNGIDQGAQANASAAMDTANFLVAKNTNEFVTAAHFGGSLGAARHLALYNRLNTYMTAVNPCPAATNYLIRTTGGNEGGNTAPIIALICGLVADGIIDGDLSGAAGCGTYLDGLYIFAQQTLADAKLNLCGTNFGLTVDVGTTFTALLGFRTFPTGIDTNYNILTAPGRKWTQSNGAIGVWLYTFTLETFVPAGASGNSALNPWYTGNVFYGRINGNLSTPWNPNPGTTGFYVSERADLNYDRLFYNGIDGGLKPGTTVALVSTNVQFGKSGNGTASTNGLSMGYMGSPLGPARQAAFYARLRTYMTAVGVP